MSYPLRWAIYIHPMPSFRRGKPMWKKVNGDVWHPLGISKGMGKFSWLPSLEQQWQILPTWMGNSISIVQSITISLVGNSKVTQVTFVIFNCKQKHMVNLSCSILRDRVSFSIMSSWWQQFEHSPAATMARIFFLGPCCNTINCVYSIKHAYFIKVVGPTVRAAGYGNQRTD